MKTLISNERLIKLEDAYAKLQALESGGVDNWEWYDEAMKYYKEVKTLSGYDTNIEFKYKNNQTVYYHNNLAKFVSYLNDKIAVIVVEAFPDFDNTDVSLCCDGCQIGDNDNKLICKCDDLSMMIENIKEITDPTYIPLIVDIKSLYDKPIVITSHESELSRIENKRKEVLEKTKELTLRNIELESKQKELDEKIKALEELSKLENN